MCLDTVTQTKGLPKWGVGYKVVGETGRPIFYWATSSSYRVKRTYNDREPITNLIGGMYNTPEVERESMLYPTGFHIFKFLDDAVEYLSDTHSDLRILRVRFSQCTAMGLDGNKVTIVARRMTILSEISS